MDGTGKGIGALVELLDAGVSRTRPLVRLKIDAFKIVAVVQASIEL